MEYRNDSFDFGNLGLYKVGLVVYTKRLKILDYNKNANLFLWSLTSKLETKLNFIMNMPFDQLVWPDLTFQISNSIQF